VKSRNLVPNLLTVAMAAGLFIAPAMVAYAGTDSTSIATENTGDAMFRRLDSNHDNFVSREEAAKQRDFLPAFDAADVNHDGKLSREEFEKAQLIYARMLFDSFVDDSVDGIRSHKEFAKEQLIYARMLFDSFVNDGVITARIKAALINDPVVSALDVNVDTDKGVVLLSGFVDNKNQVQRALAIATAVTGVKTVKSNLTVKD